MDVHNPAAYLLNALTAKEQKAFEAHIPECSACQTELEELKAGALALSLSAPPVEPPDSLKASLMAIISQEAELLERAKPEAAKAKPSFSLPQFSLTPKLGIAFMIVLALGVVFGTAIKTPHSTTIKAQTSYPKASAQLQIEDNRGTLEVRGLPDPGPGKVYQVWLHREGSTPKPTDALFTVRSGGHAEVIIPEGLEAADQVLVTAEPAGGSELPSQKPIIRAKLT